MSVPDESLEPDVAMAQIDRAEQFVRSGHRWRAGSSAALGLVTAGWFALINGVDDPKTGPLHTVISMTPILVAMFIALFHGKYHGVLSREVLRRDATLLAVFTGLLLLAMALTIFLPQGFPAVLVGALPAVPCFIWAWEAARR